MVKVGRVAGWFPTSTSTFLEYGCDAGLKASYHAAARGDEDVVITEWDGADVAAVASATGVEAAKISRAYERMCTFNAVGIPFPAAIASVVGTNTVGMTERQLLVFSAPERTPAGAPSFITQADFGPNLMASFFNARVVFSVVDDPHAGTDVLLDNDVASPFASRSEIDAARAEAGCDGIVVLAHCRISFSMPLLGGLFETFIIGLATSSASMYMTYFRDWLNDRNNRPHVPLPHIYGMFQDPPAAHDNDDNDTNNLSVSSAISARSTATEYLDASSSSLPSSSSMPTSPIYPPSSPLHQVAAVVEAVEARLSQSMKRLDDLAAQVEAVRASSQSQSSSSSSSSSTIPGFGSFTHSLRLRPARVSHGTRVAAVSNPGPASAASVIMTALRAVSRIIGKLLSLIRRIPALIIYVVPSIITLIFTIIRWRLHVQ